jgi:hypothetical protein
MEDYNNFHLSKNYLPIKLLHTPPHPNPPSQHLRQAHPATDKKLLPAPSVYEQAAMGLAKSSSAKKQ